jgi:hypothetical protein
VARIEPEKREEWEAMLNDPLPGEKPAEATPRQIEQEGMDFMAAMQMHSQVSGG